MCRNYADCFAANQHAAKSVERPQLMLLTVLRLAYQQRERRGYACCAKLHPLLPLYIDDVANLLQNLVGVVRLLDELL